MVCMQFRRLLWSFAAGALLLGGLSGCGGGEKKPAELSHVTIQSKPEEGATLSIDGQPRGETPVTLTDLAPGFYELITKKTDFIDGYEKIEVKGGVPETFVVEMEPYVGYLSIESEPDEADVVIDGEPAGKTPIIQKALRVGKHTYELSKPNYEPVKDALDVQREYKYDKTHTLKAIPAILSVSSRPTGALIYINNEQQAETSPAKFTLAAGTYLVGTWMKGYVQEEKVIELGPNDNQEVDLTMKEGDIPQGMIFIPGGPFLWGADRRAPDEAPRRESTVKDFYIDKYEVTNAQFKEVFHDFVIPKGKELHPVAGVSWNQAMKYAQAVGKRLPSEPEWEKAARGTDGREYPWGDEFDKTRCNSVEGQVGTTVRVGARLQGGSIYGVMDMAGNVAEWTFDWYDRYPGNQDVTKDYGQVYRVIRGGSFMSEKFDCRCARRHFDKVDVAKPDYGFRCAKDVEVSKK